MFKALNFKAWDVGLRVPALIRSDFEVCINPESMQKNIPKPRITAIKANIYTVLGSGRGTASSKKHPRPRFAIVSK